MFAKLEVTPMLATDRKAIATWSQRLAKYGWQTTIEPFEPGNGQHVETLFVIPDGSDEPGFALWRTRSGAYMVADWRDVGQGAPEVAMMSMRGALGAIEGAMETGEAPQRSGRSDPHIRIVTRDGVAE